MKKIYPLVLPIVLLACQGPPENEVPEHKVGYIEPNPTAGDFKPCNAEDEILEYYNGRTSEDIPAGYNGGPAAIHRYLNKQNPRLDLKSESGMYTVRFIINCEGHIGRFEVFENDLDYQPKSFDKEVAQSLLNFTKKLEDWRPNFTDGSYKDSFMYITYRLENGKILAILP